MRYRAASVFVVLGILSIGAARARACVCDTPGTVERAYADSAAVFTGRFAGEEYRAGVKSEAAEMHLGLENRNLGYRVLVQTFEVTAWFKGGFGRRTTIVTDRVKFDDGTELVSDCGLGFEKGERYLIYAYGDSKGFTTGACTRTRRLARAAADLRALKRQARR